jgi:hypothetical protein
VASPGFESLYTRIVSSRRANRNHFYGSILSRFNSDHLREGRLRSAPLPGMAARPGPHKTGRMAPELGGARVFLLLSCIFLNLSRSSSRSHWKSGKRGGNCMDRGAKLASCFRKLGAAKMKRSKARRFCGIDLLFAHSLHKRAQRLCGKPAAEVESAFPSKTAAAAGELDSAQARPESEQSHRASRTAGWGKWRSLVRERGRTQARC